MSKISSFSPEGAVKRLFDVLFILIISPVVLPVTVGIAILVAYKLGRPVIFTQDRPGINGRVFKMYKFRTMTNDTDGDGKFLPNEKRLTGFGRLLRSTSLDELPELWNVLKGDMSLVGPRPLLVDYLPLYSANQFRRHEVKPGITGWAQVNGRNAIGWNEKFKLDVWYVDNRSLLLDLKILLLTVKKVFKRDGVNSSADITMTRFTGNDE